MSYFLHNEDAFTWLANQPSDSVDLLVTDPPYESLEKHRAIGTTTRLKKSAASSNEWFEVIRKDTFPRMFQEFFRVLKKDRHLYLFCDAETMFHAKPAAESAGFRFWKPLVWDKVQIGMGYHYRARYEFILFFEKGKRRLKDLGIPDILTARRVRNGYPTEKPVELISTLIHQSTNEGELVADPFMGSGSAGEAALLGARRFLGNDKSPFAVELAHRRLSALDSVARPEAIAAPTVVKVVPGQLDLSLLE